MPQLLALAALLAGAVLAVGLGGLPWTLFAWGALAWAAAVVVKMLLGLGVDAAIKRWIRGRRGQAAAWGTWSALCELSAAAFVLAATRTDLRGAVALGLGAGAAETLLLLAVALGGREKAPDPPADAFVAWSFVMERASTLAGHTASRGLVWLAVRSWTMMPAAVLALGTFALVDAAAAYGKDVGWDWSEPRFCRRFQAFLAAVAAVETGAFAAGAAFL